MIEEVGNIVAVEQGADSRYRFWVETQIKTTCGGCQAQPHCGTGTVARAFSPKVERLCFESVEPVSIGQQVKLGIPEKTLVQLSSLFYLVPMAVLVAMTLLMQSLSETLNIDSEALVILGALSGLVASFWALRFWLKGRPEGQNYEPQLLAVLPQRVPIKVSP